MAEEGFIAAPGEQSHCPICQSDDVTGDFVEIEGPFARQWCMCNGCESIWQDRYVYEGYVLRDPARKQVDEDADYDRQVGEEL